ncbi:unnamed protein product, partial [Nesidiocoris tenuis]
MVGHSKIVKIFKTKEPPGARIRSAVIASEYSKGRTLVSCSAGSLVQSKLPSAVT